jgi:transcription antitermination factor NusG
MPDSYWSIARTEPGREHVAQFFLSREFGYEVYLPRARGSRIVCRRRIITRAPLFSSYIFVLIVDQQFYSISRSPGVVKLVFTGGITPARISDDIINGLKAQEGADGLIGLQASSFDPFRPGAEVRIIRGACTGLVAKLIALRPKERCDLLLTMLGSQRTVNMGRDDIEAISPSGAYRPKKRR